MNIVYFDSNVNDDARRCQLYNAQLDTHSPLSSSIALRDFAREMCQQVFAPYDPREAQHHMEVERFAAVLAEVKPRFIHHPKSKSLIQNLPVETGCDPEKTYFDVPRRRTSSSDD